MTPLLIAGLVACASSHTGGSPGAATARPRMTRICMTENAGYYTSSEADCRRRFALYREIGVETMRLQTGWLSQPAMVRAFRETAFEIKMILYTLGIPADYAAAHPGERMVDERGAVDWHLGPWSTDRAAVTLRAARAEIAQLRAAGLAGRVTEVVVDLGPAGEAIYPANWTMGDRPGEEAYWCYSAGAQQSFREAMRRKYATVDVANDAWGLTGDHRFSGWPSVAIPLPRTPWARGAFWNDMLLWYRDSKRRMVLERIEQTQALARELPRLGVRCIVYLPGYAYSQADWDLAVREASGPSSIRLMMDNDWLMSAAIARGCTLQYTGAENVDEVRRIVRKLRAAGSSAWKSMWGENAGIESSGRNPEWLASVITACGIRGVDFTWSSWLFESDGVTPSATFARFDHAVRMIRSFFDTGLRIPSLETADAAREVAPGVWELACSDSTRLMGSYPEVVKGGDPEIAAVAGGQTQRMLLRFPLEMLPRGQSIRSARLTMHRYRDYGDDPQPAPLGVYRVTQPWADLAANWREALDGKAWQRPGGAADDSHGTPYRQAPGLRPWATATAPTFRAAGDPVEWDVTALVQAQRAGANHGMMIVLDGAATGNKSFASRAHPDRRMQPALRVVMRPPTSSSAGKRPSRRRSSTPR